MSLLKVVDANVFLPNGLCCNCLLSCMLLYCIVCKRCIRKMDDC